MSSRGEEMVLLEEANHAIRLVDQHLAVGLEIMDETVGQGNNREEEGGDFCRLATSTDCSSGREVDGAQLSQARTQELDLGSKMVSGGA